MRLCPSCGREAKRLFRRIYMDGTGQSSVVYVCQNDGCPLVRFSEAAKETTEGTMDLLFTARDLYRNGRRGFLVGFLAAMFVVAVAVQQGWFP